MRRRSQAAGVGAGTGPPLELTQLLRRWASGDPEAGERVFDEVYSPLRRLAHHLLHSRHAPLTLPPTELVHEVYLKLEGQKRVRWRNRKQFFAVAGRCLRRLIVDRMRYRTREKRGGGSYRVTVDESLLWVEGTDLDLLALSEALKRLEEVDPRAARVVELRFFAGMDHDETAEELGIGRATVGRSWRFARAWLRNELERRSDD